VTKRMTKGEGSVYKRGNGRIVGEYENPTGRNATSSARRSRTLATSSASSYTSSARIRG
jgi:hypothetical protein